MTTFLVVMYVLCLAVTTLNLAVRPQHRFSRFYEQEVAQEAKRLSRNHAAVLRLSRSPSLRKEQSQRFLQQLLGRKFWRLIVSKLRASETPGLATGYLATALAIEIFTLLCLLPATVLWAVRHEVGDPRLALFTGCLLLGLGFWGACTGRRITRHQSLQFALAAVPRAYMWYLVAVLCLS